MNNNNNFYNVFFLIIITAFIFSSQAYLHSKENLDLTSDEGEIATATMVTKKIPKKKRIKEETEEMNSTSHAQESSAQTTASAERVKVNSPVALSGKTKAEVYRIRKKAMVESIFTLPNYTPSEEVFGSIVDGKPWISNNVCKEASTNLLGTSGPSEEARFIMNPTMLVAIEYPFSFSPKEDANWCSSYATNLMPRRITYNAEKKIITVTYEKLPFTTYKNSSFYTFNGLNARDLGYKYAYIDPQKSTYKVNFTSSDNLSTNVYEFQNYIHLGGSCGREGGCNNGSPRQYFLEFKEDATEYTKRDKTIYIKLWKNRPSTPAEKPDITEIIVLDWS